MIIVEPRGFTVSDVVTVTAAGGLTVTHTLMRVASAIELGDVNITANPQITPGDLDGQQLFIQGTSDTEKVIFEPGDGLSMSVAVTLGNNDVLVFLWDTDENVWVMVTSDTK